MKTANQTKTQWSWLKSASLTVMALATAFTVAACGNSGGGGAAPVDPGVVPPVVPSCASCPANMGFLTSGLVQSGGARQIEMGLQFFGDLGRMNTTVAAIPAGGYLSAPNAKYYGMVGAQGYLLAGTNLVACGLPAGLYTLTTQTTGVWGGDGYGRSQQGLTLISTSGPAQIAVSFNTMIESAAPPMIARYDGAQYPNVIMGQIVIANYATGTICSQYF